MRFFIDDLEVFFPYDFIYPEQHRYMCELYKAIKGKGHALLEMANAAGRMVSSLSLITSYLTANKGEGVKFVYCTRTVTEMEIISQELANVIKYIKSSIASELKDMVDIDVSDGDDGLTAIAFSSKKNLCLNERATIGIDGFQTESSCRTMTASWVRASENSEDQKTVCNYYLGYEREMKERRRIFFDGVYRTHDLNAMGKKNGWCPYFTARQALADANIILCPYEYMLDQKASENVLKNLSKNTIILFDEAHTIDIASMEAFSIYINNNILRRADAALKRLEALIKPETGVQTSQKLLEEYERLVNGLSETVAPSDELLGSPVCSKDLPTEPMPGNIRVPKHFLVLLRRTIECLRGMMEAKTYLSQPAGDFCAKLYQNAVLDRHTLRYVTQRFNSLLNSLEIDSIIEYKELRVIADMMTVLGTYGEGFVVTFEPHDERTPTFADPALQVACVDPTIILKTLFKRYDSLVITSGTLSPLNMYQKLLGFTPMVSKSMPLTLSRNVACPVVLNRGSDQVAVSTRYKTRNDPSIVRNYGTLLVELSKYVPDGIVCFFISYQYLDETVSMWHQMGLLESMRRSKSILVETPNMQETCLALNNYRKACDSGRGAILFTVARGNIPDSINFSGQYGRAIVVVGLPFVNSDNQIVKARLEFMKKRLHIDEKEYLTFDALRYTSSVLASSLSNKNDYSIMVLADRRYNQSEKRNILPEWIQQQLANEHLNLSTDTLMRVVRKFLKEVVQMSSVTDRQVLREADLIKIPRKLK